MVDTRNVAENYKSLRLFSLPHKPLALNLMIDRENTILGYDNCGSNYVGKLGDDLKLCLISFNSDSPTLCLSGRIDLDTKRIIGDWMSCDSMEEVVLEMISYGSCSRFDVIPNHDLDCFKGMTREDLLNQFKISDNQQEYVAVADVLENNTCKRLFLAK